MDAAIALEPNNPSVYNNRGILQWEAGDSREALVDMDKSIELRPNISYAHLNRGFIKASLREFPAAFRDIDRAFQLDPNIRNERIAAPEIVDHYTERGRQLADSGDLDGALVEFNKAVTLGGPVEQFPSSQVGSRRKSLAVALGNRGLIWLRKGNETEAQKDLAKCLMLDPGSRSWLEDQTHSSGLQFSLNSIPPYQDERRPAAAAVLLLPMTASKPAETATTQPTNKSMPTPVPASVPQMAPTESVLVEDVVNGSQFFASPDLRHVVYTKTADRKTSLVVDGQEGKQYDGIFSVTFSPDGRRFAYIATKDGKSFTVLEDQEGPQFDMVDFLTFSSDGKRFAYRARTLGAVNQFVILDGAEGKQYYSTGGLIFSPDNKHYAYDADPFAGGAKVMVFDGKEGKPFQSITFPVFSQDSQHFAYVAKEAGKVFSVVDDKEGKKFEGSDFWLLSLSPDGRRLAYFVLVETAGKWKWFVVVDEQEGKKYEISRADESLLAASLLFSPDSKRVAYSGKVNTPEGRAKWLVAVDDQDGKQYDSVARIVFSPDSKRVAYAARAGRKGMVVVDGVEGRQYDRIGSITFSPDSKHIAYVAGMARGPAEEEYFVVVDGVERKRYDDIAGYRQEYGLLVNFNQLIFDTPDKFHYIARKGNKLLLVQEKIAALMGNGYFGDQSVRTTNVSYPISPKILIPDQNELTQAAPAKYQVKFETSKGDFVMEVYRDWSPNGADRLYYLVQNGF